MDVKYMYEALKEAKKAYKKKEIPIGTIILNELKFVFSPNNPNNAANCSIKKFRYLKYSSIPAPSTTPKTTNVFGVSNDLPGS